jgi:cobalamin biosynthesis Co2+ chelatase CbiK
MKKVLSLLVVLAVALMGLAAFAEDADKAAAAAVDELIAVIQAQEWTEETDAQTAAAKEAWDALTDAQKELVEEGDYFGRDTGDAAADDPLNADDIGENELLVVSFGTSFNDSRVADIGGIEKALQEAYPDWAVRRAFTAQIIINHIAARDGEKIDNVAQALERAVANGVKNLVVQPTHLMHGAEYDELVNTVAAYTDKFENVAVAEPLLGEVGADATVINEDKSAVAALITAEAVEVAGYETLDAAAEDGTAFVFMGHGTSHTANVTYDQMQSTMDELGYKNVFIGTVEGEPEDTECSVVIGKVKEAGFTKVVLRPLMVVAGDHANNDMADPEDEESWISQFTADGSFEKIDCQIEGLGRIEGVEQLYIAHAGEGIAAINID